MIEFQHTVKDPNGMHARPAGLFVKTLAPFSSEVTVHYGEKSVSGRKLIALLALSIKCGDTVTVTVSGEDEKKAAEALRVYLDSHL